MDRFNVCSYLVVIVLSLNNLAYAMEQRVGDYEIAIDAPWRMEPRLKPRQLCQAGQACGSGTAYIYGAIPVNIAILDALLPRTGTPNSLLLQRAWQAKERDDVSIQRVVNQLLNPAAGSLLEEYPNTVLESYQSLRIYEEIDGNFVQRATYPINQLHEVERTTGFWKWSNNESSPPTRPSRALCRRWQGDSCVALASLRNSSEWHGIAMYEPAKKIPGTDVKLKLELTLATSSSGTQDTNTYTQYVNIHLGESPLPKFSQNWYYGDIHYHSQGTDNDGESGYSYRSALQAMSALGLDFAFATDHASNSQQIMSAARDSAYSGSLQNLGPLIPGVLRDLSPDRFAHNIGIVNNEAGANRQVASYPRKLHQLPSNMLSGSAQRSLVIPQLFLGAEVDVIPEFASNKIPPFEWGASCTALSPFLIALDKGLVETAIDGTGEFLFPSGQKVFKVCDGSDLLEPSADGRSLIKDVQGPDGADQLSKHFYGRQHVLHLPEDPQKTDAFIASNTSKYGGATRRLKEVLSSEFNTPNGILFLAHPLSTPSGSGVDRLGPDIAPYSEASLLDAFRSEHVLGLQLWNENHRFESAMGRPIPTKMKEVLGSANYVKPTKKQVENAIAQANASGFAKAQALISELKYADIIDEYGDALSTRPDKGVASTYEPFGLKGEMIPVKDLKKWRHQTSKSDSNFGKNLRMWDSMLMWGIDSSLTSSITWLPQGQPRRVFMAGGSDAHGDYNYMRHGYFVGITSISDGAMGTPRNLLFAGAPQGKPITVGQNTGTPVSQKQIVDAFRDGNFIVTDGPIIRLAYDRNGNGVIDPQDISMGGLAKIGGSPTNRHIRFPLLVEWKSTPEFGPVKEISLEIGVFSDKYSDGWFYRPWQHPSVEKPFGIPGVTQMWKEKETGRIIYAVSDPEFQGRRGRFHQQFVDPTENTIMTLDIAISEHYAGVRTLDVNPQDFPVASLHREHFYSQPECDAQRFPAVAYRQQGHSPVEVPRPGNMDDLEVIDDDGLGGEHIPDGPLCSFAYFENPAVADRMYIRAELKGAKKGAIPYKAFTNPIWFNVDDRYANAGSPVVIYPDKMTETSPEKVCSSKSTGICQSKKARCDVLSDRRGSAKDVCRWSSIKTAARCQSTAGIWTTPLSKYAKNHPQAITPGTKGACITEVKNIKRVFLKMNEKNGRSETRIQ